MSLVAIRRSRRLASPDYRRVLRALTVFHAAPGGLDAPKMNVLNSVPVTDFATRMLAALAVLVDDCSYASISTLDRPSREYQLITAARVHSTRPRVLGDASERLGRLIRHHEGYCRVQDGWAAGHVLADADVMSRSQLIESAPYRDLYRPHNVGFSAGFTMPGIACESSPYYVAVFRNETPLRPREVATLTLLRDQLLTYAPNARQFEPVRSLNASPGAASQLMTLGLRASEAAVLFWASEGKRDGEIATILGKSVRTVNGQMRRIFEVLHVETRTAAAALAIEHLKVSNAR